MSAAHDIRPNWLNVARRCQSVVGSAHGFAVVRMQILVGPGGEPVMWLEPQIQRIEPMGSASLFLHTVLEKMEP